MSNSEESIIQLSVTEQPKPNTKLDKKEEIKKGEETKKSEVKKEEKPKPRTTEEILRDFYINPESDTYKLDPTFEVCIIGDSKKITGKQSLLAKPIIRFFNDKNNLRKLIPMLNSTSRISLRIIDWFVTNYCKGNGTLFNKKVYELDDKLILKKWLTDAEKEVFTKRKALLDEYKKDETKLSSFDNFIIIHNDYKSQLKSYNKKNFDPFCRRDRVNLYYVKGKYISTTIGQLNFFKWAIENYVVNYILDNIFEIEANIKQMEEILTTEGEEEEEEKVDENKSDSSNDEQIEITGDKIIGEVKKVENKPEINKRIINKKIIKKSGSGKGKQPDKSMKKKVEISSNVNTEEDLSKKKYKRRKIIGTKKRKVDKNIVSHKSMTRHNCPTIISFD